MTATPTLATVATVCAGSSVAATVVWMLAKLAMTAMPTPATAATTNVATRSAATVEWIRVRPAMTAIGLKPTLAATTAWLGFVVTVCAVPACKLATMVTRLAMTAIGSIPTPV